MKVTDQNTMLHQLSRGATFAVKGDSLHALDGAARKWENVLNLFRSHKNLARREAATLTAMADMLRPQSTSGPENLSAGRRPSSISAAAGLLRRLADRLEERPSPAASPQITLWEARTNFTQALLTKALDRFNPAVPQNAVPSDAECVYDVPPLHSRADSLPGFQTELYDTPRARSASAPDVTSPPPLSPRKMFSPSELGILHSVLSSALCAPTVMGTASLTEMHGMVEAAVVQALRDTPPGSLLHLRTGFVRDTAAMAGYQTALAQELHTAVNDAVSHTFLFNNHDICLSTQKTFPMEHPIINGFRAPGGEENAADVNAAYARTLDLFCKSPAEKRALSYLMGPDGRPALDRVLAGAHGIGAGLHLNRIDRPLPEGSCSLRRGDNGEALLDVVVPLAPSGQALRLDLPDGRNLHVRVREDVPMAQLRYTVAVPRDTQASEEPLYENMSSQEHVYESLDDIQQSAVIPAGVGGVSLWIADMRLEVDGQPVFTVDETATAS